MVRQSWFEYGNTFGMRYLFEKRGDGLSMHKHPPDQDHNVIVLRGAIQVTGRNDNSGPTKAAAPAIIEILPKWHELVALEPGTELLNLYRHGKPAGYELLPDSEKDVTFETKQLESPLGA
jgi:quercetin dioxygenase-like cupin family protein